MNRRHVLQTGVASLIIIGGAPACREDAPASSAWRAAPSEYEELPIRYLASAILAPSPHNRQPWLIALDPDDPMRMTLFADLTRLLPETDPPNRQILIGLGAFLETLSMAAAEEERAVNIEMFPQGVAPDHLDARPIVQLTLGEVGTARPDPLFNFVSSRRTNRTRFDDVSVAKDELLGLGTALNAPNSFWGASADPEFCETLRDLCKIGWEIEIQTKRTHAESVALTRIGRKEIEANPDGISLSGPMMGAYSTLGILSREKMKDPQSRAFKGGLDFYNGLIESARSFAWLATMDNSRESQLSAGRDWMRVHLAATRAGLAFQPLSQVLQEFPEMRPLYASIHEATGIQAPSRIQGLFRIGFATTPDPSPRWPLQTRLIDISD
ncbi:MAG: twin-arginine translocation pathway signal protein [Pseudomonadota bacterium]